MEIKEGYVYGQAYHYLCPEVTHEMQDWINENFGPEGSKNKAQERWYYEDFHLWIRDDQDLSSFLLKWA